MLPPIPSACPVIVIEGIPGAGKSSLQERLRREVRDRPLHVYPEEALLLHWTHAWIPGIHPLRLALMARMLDHVETVLAATPDALFVLTRFHLSYVLLGGEGDDPRYRQVVARLAALGAEAWVPMVPDAAIAARAIHPERRDPQWQAHLQRRLACEGYADLTTMYVQYQQDLRAILERQPIPHRLLPPR
jgi:hypothetical protein